MSTGRLEDLFDLVDNLRGRGLSTEPSFYDGPIGTDPHPSGVSTRSGQQMQTGDDHRLTGTRFAGEHGESFMELCTCGRYDTEAVDSNFFEHSLPRPPPPSLDG